MAGWIGVDFDCTLVRYPTEGGIRVIGEPIKLTMDRVLDWLNSGQEVRIFTARAGDPELKAQVEAWAVEHLGRAVQVTDKKDFGMIELWDDRAITVEANTGRVLTQLIR